MNFTPRYLAAKRRTDAYLEAFIQREKPDSLYAPAKYIVRAGGKRIRPVLTLFACRAVGGNEREAIHAAAAMEIVHTFTLVHDDIMDHAPSRRGKPTVHTKWDTNVAILTGDALLALAYRALLKTSSDRIREISRVFTEGVVDVCEGQAYDKEFETRRVVSVDDYLLMIRKKTGTLVAVATELGGLIGGAPPSQRTALRRYGEYLGRAFQIQDDLLDLVGDVKTFGKAIGGDLVEGKKTFLLLEALRRSTGRDRSKLMRLIREEGIPRREVPAYREVIRSSGALETAEKRILQDVRRAIRELDRLPASQGRSMLAWFAEMLLHRTF